MAGDHKQSDAALLEQLAGRMRESLLPVDQPFENAELERAASLVLETAERRASGEPAVTITDGVDGSRKLRIALVNDDMPFLVDSISAQIADFGLSIDRLVLPVVRVVRDEDGALCARLGVRSPELDAVRIWRRARPVRRRADATRRAARCSA